MQGRNGGYGQDFGRSPPVNVGDELDVRIEAVGEKGDGVAKKDGFVLFVPNVKEGDNVRIKVTRVLRKVGFADVIGKSESAPSDDQAESPAEEAEPDYDESKDSEDFGDEPAEESSDEESDSKEEDFTEEPEEEVSEDESKEEKQEDSDDDVEEPMPPEDDEDEEKKD